MNLGRIENLNVAGDSKDTVFTRIVRAVRKRVDAIFPGADTIARNEALAVRRVCCGLLVEMAQLDSAYPSRKRAAVTQMLVETFAMGFDEAAALIAAVDGKASRYTSYYEPVALINKLWSPTQKVQFIEQLWRVAAADGELDMYEEHLVRKLAELLYVSHTDFILAKYRVLGST